MVLQQSKTNDRGQRLPTVPEWWTVERGGSAIEYYVWQAILKTRRIENIDFVYQNDIFGGQVLGGAVVDFLIFSPRVGINVQSLFYHGTEAQQRAFDLVQLINIGRNGLRIAYISEFDAINRPDGAVRDAIENVNQRGPLGD